jgi:formyltetrahydrofolate deformylase
VASCPDTVGVVAETANFIAEPGGFLTESSHHTNVRGGWFLVRHVIEATHLRCGLDSFKVAFQSISKK